MMAILRVKDNEGNIIDIPAIKGDTPKKGVDYWTDEDKAEMKDYINQQLGVVENGTY